MGPDRNAQLDDFSLVLPFAYRVAVLLVAGMFGSRLGGKPCPRVDRVRDI